MNGCEPLRDHLMDHALGEPASAVLMSHLRGCRTCAAEIERLRAVGQRIDAGVRRLTSVEPGPHAISRVRAAIQTRAPARAWRSWAVATIAAIAAIVVIAFLLPSMRTTSSTTIAVTTHVTQWRSPTASLLRSTSDPLLNGRMQDLFDSDTRPFSQPHSFRKNLHA